MKKAVWLIGLLALIGCTEAVPPGYVGMIMTPAGLTGDPLQPGRHSCWGRDRMILIETRELAQRERFNILAADDMNISFDIITKTRLASRDGSAIKELLNRQGSAIKDETLKMDILYKTYIKPVLEDVRTVVSKYETTQVRMNREVIQKEVNKRLKIGLKGTPVELVAAYTSNFDYPDIITKAMERKKEREVQIKEEEARQAVKLLEAKNRQELAKAERVTRIAEAEAEAAYMKIINDALTPAYLERKRIETQMKLYSNVAAGDKVIVSGNGAIPIVGK